MQEQTDSFPVVDSLVVLGIGLVGIWLLVDVFQISDFICERFILIF